MCQVTWTLPLWCQQTGSQPSSKSLLNDIRHKNPKYRDHSQIKIIIPFRLLWSLIFARFVLKISYLCSSSLSVEYCLSKFLLNSSNWAGLLQTKHMRPKNIKLFNILMRFVNNNLWVRKQYVILISFSKTLIKDVQILRGQIKTTFWRHKYIFVDIKSLNLNTCKTFDLDLEV